MNIEELLKRVMIDYGAMQVDWKLKVSQIELNCGDWATIHFSITRPRKRKPCTLWSMKANIATGFIDWQNTEHVNC